jgi:type II secretory pathway pseudopilin PulG
MKPEHNTEAGFTLIETLVAFVILSGVVIIALSTMSESLQRMQQAARVVEASRFAQRTFDDLFVEIASTPKTYSGQDDKYRWRIEIVELPGPSEAMIFPALFKVSVENSKGRSIPQAHIESIRMIRRP